MEARDNDTVVRPIEQNDLEPLLDYDRALFGADRHAIVQHLRERVPERALHARRGETIVGYVLARDGRNAHHLGPLIADDWLAARSLAVRALVDIDRPVYVDVPDHQMAFSAWLDEHGFVTQRPFTRMLFERSDPYDAPDHVFAIAGPELG